MIETELLNMYETKNKKFKMYWTNIIINIL